MSRRPSSIGFLGVFGRSADLKALDAALRARDLHPRVVPEAVKLTVANLLKDHAVGAEPAPQAYPTAAEILAYCMLGPELFERANGPDALASAEGRIEAALERGDGLDARLVLLAMHAGVIQPEVVARFGLESE